MPIPRATPVEADPPGLDFAMVVRMSSNSVDPSGNTEAFRAFTQTPEPAAAGASKKQLLAVGVAALVVLLAVLAWLALS